MIAVAVQPDEEQIATEFFELFKTPWEFYRDNGGYKVVICTSDAVDFAEAELVLIFGARSMHFDIKNEITLKLRSEETVAQDEQRKLPLYSGTATFGKEGASLLTDSETNHSVAMVVQSGKKTVLRIGYNLFREAQVLLTVGQPTRHAALATLENHISLLREWITGAGIPLVEIPPVPDGHGFIACLTHDIDHPVLRNHCCDHTMFGFLYRATVGSALEVMRGRKPIKTLWRNLAAASRLPFVYFGLARDFWRGFDRYLEIEAEGSSTYFVIPQRDHAGRNGDTPSPAKRACRYELAEVLPQLRRLTSAGNEVSLHGLDAWLDAEAGRKERDRLVQALGGSGVGVRMHWLFFNVNSPAALDRAGFSYDSTVGYCDTVGYRAGTAQAYKPPGSMNLLELPLHVMDTALFYPAYLNLDDASAERLVRKLLDDVQQFGGALTVNWHDRSIAPERLWDDFYLKLLMELRQRGAWFATAGQAVSWFRKRRSAVLVSERQANGEFRVKGKVRHKDGLPRVKVRVHKPRIGGLAASRAKMGRADFVDTPLDEEAEWTIAI